MIVYIDVDETVCEIPEEYGRDYTKAIPIEGNIVKLNRYYDEGNTVIYWTARGTTTGIDWREITEKQLEEWGLRYHELKFEKPYYDLFIDDKALNIKEL